MVSAEEQESSSYIAELADMEAAAAVDETHLSRDKKWKLFLCQEQMIQQRVKFAFVGIGFTVLPK